MESFPMTDVREILRSPTASTALLLNLSGGKDSTRMLGLVREKYPTVKTYAVMADTGFEHVKQSQQWSCVGK